MESLSKKKVLVVGLGISGIAACNLLLSQKADVTAIDQSEERNEDGIEALSKKGTEIQWGVDKCPEKPWDLVVLSPGIDPDSSLLKNLDPEIDIIGELELASRLSQCLNIAISGTNGKTTVTQLIDHILTHSLRKVAAAGNIGVPYCEVVPKSRDLDFAILEVSSYQLQTIKYFRPVIGVLTNISPDHFERHNSLEEYARSKAEMFKNQQLFDWAIIQSEALAYLRTIGENIRSKTITFSSKNRNADIYCERGMIVSRIPDWAGPILDVEKLGFMGGHNAENIMAALCVGRVLRVPLEQMVEAIKTFKIAPHRCELIAEEDEVKWINDSKSTNSDSLEKAIEFIPLGHAGEPNIWLIAGGADKGLQYHDLGPLLARRVKGVFLLGENKETLQSAWSLFTSCYEVKSLKEAVDRARISTEKGDYVLLSPASSSFDMFDSYQDRGDQFKKLVLKS